MIVGIHTSLSELGTVVAASGYVVARGRGKTWVVLMNFELIVELGLVAISW